MCVSLAPSTTKEDSSDSDSDESTGIIAPNNKDTADVAACAPNRMINDDDLNKPAANISSCTANRMVNDDNLIQTSDDIYSSSEDVFTFTKNRM